MTTMAMMAAMGGIMTLRFTAASTGGADVGYRLSVGGTLIGSDRFRNSLQVTGVWNAGGFAFIQIAGIVNRSLMQVAWIGTAGLTGSVATFSNPSPSTWSVVGSWPIIVGGTYDCAILLGTV